MSARATNLTRRGVLEKALEAIPRAVVSAFGLPITATSANLQGAQKFDSVGVLFFLGMPATPNGIYPGGRYVVLYDGETIRYRRVD